MWQPGTEPDPEADGDPTTSGAGVTATNGSLAASMERLVMLAATALRAPLAFIVLSGDDRRCFAAGPFHPAWIAHDPGVVRRSGLAPLVEQSTSPIMIQDLIAQPPSWDSQAIAALEFRSVAAAAIRLTTGESVGAVYAADGAPMAWSDEDVEMLGQIAGMAAADVELRRTLAEREALERQLRFDARHDPLTGLANRSVLVERLRAALERQRPNTVDLDAEQSDHVGLEPQSEDLVAVVFIDINDFRTVNERFGHQLGDQLLSSLALRLRRMAGSDALVARLGGDEFAVLMEHVPTPEHAEQRAEHFRVTLSQPTVIAGEKVPLSVSVGLSLSTIAAELPEYMLRGADLAMARAKRDARSGGGAPAVLFDWRISSDTRSRRRLEDELRRAVREDQFVLHYLPTISLVTGGITGAEALLRWNHRARGLLGPHEFLGVAEELDIISDIGRWVLREACRQVQEWSRTSPGPAPLSIAVNLSARQFTSSELLVDVERAIRDFALPPASLALEVNERAVARDVSRAAGALTGLRALGARIHLDDFGAGNSPLQYLQLLPLDVVKVDHTLVGRMDRDAKAMRLVRSVVGLARELGLDVIAEGIASAAHLKVLQELGCTHGQGALFSRATDPAGITAMLQQRPW